MNLSASLGMSTELRNFFLFSSLVGVGGSMACRKEVCAEVYPSSVLSHRRLTLEVGQ